MVKENKNFTALVSRSDSGSVSNAVRNKGWIHRGSNIWCLCEDLENENETGVFSVEIENGKQAFVVSMTRALNKSEMDSLFTLMDLLSRVP